MRLVDDVIAGLRAAGRTVILATHLMDRAVMHADRGVALDGGRLVYDGPAQHLPGVALSPVTGEG
jgi:ABC-type multidrug transport system ATPase subunit